MIQPVYMMQNDVDGKPIIELLSYRIYGQPKIAKPKMLSGIKPAYTLAMNRRKVQAYIIGNDLVVYFPDLFSKIASFPDAEDMTLPTSALQRKYNFAKKVKNKFIYADGWCRIYNRNEGYVIFRNIIDKIQNCDHLPWLMYECTETFVSLTKADPGFCTISSDTLDERYADYDRLITDMFVKIRVKHNHGRIAS